MRGSGHSALIGFCLAGAAVLVLAQPAGAQGDAQGDAPAAPHAGARIHPTAAEAFATLVYSDLFLLGARVLGQSLRETGTTRDLVALVTESVSQQAADTLALDGWKVQRVGLVTNPGTWTQDPDQRFPPRFWGVFTKLLIFNLTQYQRVVYLDADTIASRSLDELFLFDGLCAVMRAAERVNTGVMVLTPSAALFRAMMAAVPSTPSYTGGDQGFLNSFLPDFPEAPLFDPRRGRQLSEVATWRSDAPGAPGLALGRLPTVYNADLGLYLLNSNRWTLPAEEIRVLHFTLATFKPWDWWAGWIMGETSARWQALRSRLPAAADGLAGGKTAQQQLAALVLLPLPLVIAALLVRRCLWQRGLGQFARSAGGRLAWAVGAAGTRARALKAFRPRGGGGSGGGSPCGSPQSPCCRAEQQQQLLMALDLPAAAAAALPAAAPPAWLTAAAAGAGMAAVAVGLGVSMALIPRQVVPAVGWCLAYQWTALCIVLPYSLFLQACHRLGRGGGAVSGAAAGATVPAAPLPAVHAAGSWAARPWGASLALFAATLACLGLVPWSADILGVPSFASKAITTFLLGAISGILCTQCFIGLATRWYQSGAAEAALARSASKLDV